MIGWLLYTYFEMIDNWDKQDKDKIGYLKFKFVSKN